MKKKASAIKVKLRQKPISGGRQSLYLDFYPAIISSETEALTRREFLGLYLYDKAKSPADKLHNKETEALAQQIRQQKEIELNKGEVYSVLEREVLKKQQLEKSRGQKDFVAYFATLADKRKASNHDNWISALHYLQDFTKGSLKFANLTESWCNDFKAYLGTAKSFTRKIPLAINTTVSYFNKLKAALKQAYKDGLLTVDLNSKIDCIKTEETHRQFLTIEELNCLVRAECAIPIIKQAALFSALTGLRHSDIQKLIWSEIGEDKNGYYLQFQQQRTGGTEVTPISEQAYGLLGMPGKSTDKVFLGLTYSAYHNRALYTWLGVAGITRHINLHCFCNTYTTLLLSKAANMAIVTRCLGTGSQKPLRFMQGLLTSASEKQPR